MRLYDGCIDYGDTVSNILDQDGVDDGFLEYYWSDPRQTDDLVVDDDGNSIRGLSPGTSVKIGYFLETDFDIPFGATFIIGSGIYPEDQEYYVPEGEMCQDVPDDLSLVSRTYLDRFPVFPGRDDGGDDDGGCSIASSVEEGNGGKVAGLNLLLIAAFMFGVFGGKKLLGRKN